MSKKAFLAIAILFIATVSFGQGETSFSKDNFPEQIKELKEARRNLTYGDIQFENEKFGTALKYYLKANNFNPNNNLLNYKIGQCYFYTNNDSAEMFFQKSIAIDKNPELDNNLYLGMIHHQNYKFDKAISNYHAFADDLLKRSGIQDNKKLDRINKLIEECESGKKIMVESTTVKIENLSKTMAKEGFPYSDYSIYSTNNDSLLYFTSIRSKNPKEKNTQVNDNWDEDIYLSTKKNGQRENAQNIGKPINTGSNDAIVGLSRDGNTMYIYADSNNGDIYISTKKDGTWSVPLIFSGRINSDAMESSLTFSSMGDTLFFVSNRSGSYGGKDIFYAVKEGDDWGNPINLGATINTKYDEEAVFMDGDTLYFASKGHNTMGGYDIFKSHKGHNNQWSEPQNLLFPINSPLDDIFYSSNRYYIYFASNRSSQSSIYSIKKVFPKKEMMVAVADSTIVPIEDFFIIQDIEFALEKYINKDAYPMLDSLANYLVNNPDAKIKISGYTDLQGNKNYNIKLSAKRANFVKNYLIKKGVNDQNLVAEGNGWSKQISKNKNEKGKFIWKSLGYNRRVEFEVIKQGTPKLIVQNIDVPDSFRTEKPKHFDIYSVLLVVSDNEISDIGTKIEDYNLYKGTDLKYYYYTGKFEKLTDVQIRKDELGAQFPDAKIFVHKFKNMDDKGHEVYRAVEIE